MKRFSTVTSLMLLVFLSCTPKKQLSNTASEAASLKHEISMADYDLPEVFTTSNKDPLGIRLQSFGNTTYEIQAVAAESNVGPIIDVEGALPGTGDSTAVGAGPILTQLKPKSGRSISTRVSLANPGAYRLILKSDADSSTSHIKVTVSCIENCSTPSISSEKLVSTIANNPEKRAKLQTIINAYLQKFVTDSNLRALLQKQLESYMQGAVSGNVVSRFPEFNMDDIALARAYVGQYNSTDTIPDADMSFNGKNIVDILGDCALTRSQPQPINTSLPEVGRGEFPDLSLTQCEVAHSAKLTKVLNSLVAGRGISVTLSKESASKISSPRELFESLIKSGHRIVMQNVRMYANFMGLTSGNFDVVWPTWFGTKIKLANNEELEIPFGHSEHDWIIRGPIVNTRVRYFMGVSGIGFYSQAGVRPGWSGHKVAYSLSTENGSADTETILKAADVTAAYYQRIKKESVLANGKSMRIDGYGILGVCNDSNAIIEKVTRGSISTFPLLRSLGFDADPQAPKVHDILDDAIHTLPRDADFTRAPVSPEFRADMLHRILQMSSVPQEKIAFYLGEKYATQMSLVVKEAQGF